MPVFNRPMFSRAIPSRDVFSKVALYPTPSPSLQIEPLRYATPAKPKSAADPQASRPATLSESASHASMVRAHIADVIAKRM